MNAKDIVSQFYSSDALWNPEKMNLFLHQDATLDWKSSKGSFLKTRSQILDIAIDLQNSYSAIEVEVIDLMQENDKVAVFYNIYVNPIEAPNSHTLLAHFACIWKIKDEKLYQGVIISQIGE